jgi:CheY-like chemotaxis protein
MVRKVCLLIDDDGDDREVFAVAMSEIYSGLDVLMTDNATEAIQNIRDGKIRPDVIFLDLNMPGVNGYQFLVYLKGQIRYKKIPVVVYSTSNDPEEIRRTKKLGAATFFEKPVTFCDLKKRLALLLGEMGILLRQPAS